MSIIEVDARKKKENIKEIMQKMGIKQSDVAEVMGVTASTISRRIAYGSWMELSKIESVVIELSEKLLNGKIDPL